jgi:hypothetical protein
MAWVEDFGVAPESVVEDGLRVGIVRDGLIDADRIPKARVRT